MTRRSGGDMTRRGDGKGKSRRREASRHREIKPTTAYCIERITGRTHVSLSYVLSTKLSAKDPD
jgi:hypothetical protein